MAIPLVYNVRNVIQRPVSTITTAVGVGLTVAVLLAALALAEGFRASQVSTGSPDNALVLRKGADNEVSSGIDRAGADIIRAHPLVATGPDGRPLVSAEMVAMLNLDRLGQRGSSNIRLRGVDLAAIGIRTSPRVAAGRMFTPGTDEVVVGSSIARRFRNCGVGDELVMQKRKFKVVGHFSAAGSAYESEIWGDANVVMPVMHREGAYQVIVARMKDPAQFPRFKQELEKDPRLTVQVDRENEFFAEQSQLLTGLITTLGIFVTGIMAVGALFGAANTMFAAVAGRTREIALLLVLGFSPFSLMVSFMIESMLVALVGGALGCLIALPVNGITTSTTNFQSFSEVAFQFRVTPPLIATALIFSALLGLMGGFFPALRAANQPLARTLRGG